MPGKCGTLLRVRFTEGLGFSLGGRAASWLCLGLSPLTKDGVHASLPTGTTSTENSKNIWIYAKSDRLLRGQLVLTSNYAKLRNSGGRTAAMGDDAFLPVDPCWRRGWARGCERRSNLFRTKELRSTL
jgi:hypothetical protein